MNRALTDTQLTNPSRLEDLIAFAAFSSAAMNFQGAGTAFSCLGMYKYDNTILLTREMKRRKYIRSASD